MHLVLLDPEPLDNRDGKASDRCQADAYQPRWVTVLVNVGAGVTDEVTVGVWAKTEAGRALNSSSTGHRI